MTARTSRTQDKDMAWEDKEPVSQSPMGEREKERKSERGGESEKRAVRYEREEPKVRLQ